MAHPVRPHSYIKVVFFAQEQPPEFPVESVGWTWKALVLMLNSLLLAQSCKSCL